MKPVVLVTCGPSHEPVDRVRRLTNASTGELGVRLSEALAMDGFRVICLKGESAIHPDPAPGIEVRRFGTNSQLLDLLREISARESVFLILHAAALCDFRVAEVRDESGGLRVESKIPSRQGGLCLRLEPALKVISQLRALFPHSRIVGWKYETEGTREDGLNRARSQVRENQTDACVLNGPVCGSGFLVCWGAEGLETLPGRSELVGWIVAQARCWLRTGGR